MSVREAVRLCVHISIVWIICVGSSDYEYLIDTVEVHGTSEYATIPVGSSVTLICPNRNLRNRVTWYKASITEYAAYSDYHGRRCIINNRKYPSLKLGPYDCAKGNFSVTFPSISYSDQGKWRCHTKEFTSAFVNMTVLPLSAFTTTTPTPPPTTASILRVSLVFRRRKKGYTMSPDEDPLPLPVTTQSTPRSDSSTNKQPFTDKPVTNVIQFSTIRPVTSKPAFGTSKPDLSTSKPDLSTSKPDLSTSKPDLSTSKSGIGPNKPGLSTFKPERSSISPYTPTVITSTEYVPTIPTRDVVHDDTSSIVGGVLGLIVFLLFACFLLVLLVRHRRKRPKCLRSGEEGKRMQAGPDESHVATTGGRSTVNPILWLRKLPDMCRLSRRKVDEKPRPDSLLNE